MGEQCCAYVLLSPEVDQPGGVGVPELVGMDAHWPAGLVMKTDLLLPGAKPGQETTEACAVWPGPLGVVA